MHLYAGGVAAAGLPELIRRSPSFASISVKTLPLTSLSVSLFSTLIQKGHTKLCHSFTELCHSALFSLEELNKQIRGERQ